MKRVTSLDEIANTPAFPEAVQGVMDWVQRNALYNHTQPIRSTAWTIVHNLGSIPQIHTYTNQWIDGVAKQVSTTPTKISTINANTTVVSFDTPQSGVAQCVAVASQSFTSGTYDSALTSSSGRFQITSDTGELTIATIDDSSEISIESRYHTGGPVPITTIKYLGIDRTASGSTPWAGAKHVIISGKKYTVRSFNLTKTPRAPAYFAAGAIPDGTAFNFMKGDSTRYSPGEALILLGTSPYGPVDRVFDKYVDLASISPITPELGYTNSTAYAQLNMVRSTYPLILVV